MIGFATYDVSRISVPAGAEVAAVSESAQPQTAVSMGRSGALGIILRRRGHRIADVVLIVRPNGSTTRLSLPSDRFLTRFFRHPLLRTNGEIFPTKQFEAITLADDGTPFVTVSALFTGAYFGWDRRTFIWNGRWVPAFPQPLPVRGTPGTGNCTVSSAVSVTSYVATIDYSDLLPPPIGAAGNQDEVLLRKGRSISNLGSGDAYAIRNGLSVGSAPGGSIALPSAQVRAATWADTRLQTVGAGVERAVNRSGVAAGDDEATRERLGKPVVWRNSVMERITGEQGSAYAISDAGLVVGATSGGGFIAQHDGKRWSVRKLDDAIAGRRWHVAGAFAIADSGNILALASIRPSLNQEFIVLKPRGK